jgi:hypothetical protein
MVQTPGLGDTLYLITKGIPYDTAMRLSPAKRLAMCIMLGELDGGTWDWDLMAWAKQ